MPIGAATAREAERQAGTDPEDADDGSNDTNLA